MERIHPPRPLRPSAWRNLVGIAVCAAAALFWAACVAIGSGVARWASSPGLVIAACLFLIAQTMASFLSSLTRTVVGYLLGESLREAWRLVVIVGALCWRSPTFRSR